MKTMQKIDRRRFIEAAASAAALGGIGLPLSARSAANLARLRSAVRGHVITPADSAYRSKSEPWNARFANVLPAAVVIVADAHDVGRTIAFAREHDLPFVVRNGGHSFAGFSASHGLIIDVSALREVRIDRKNQRATFGAGFTNLALYETLWPARMSLPAGTCPTVGVTGLSQAGGFGRLSRLYGLTCDNILELKVVAADGLEGEIGCNLPLPLDPSAHVLSLVTDVSVAGGWLEFVVDDAEEKAGQQNRDVQRNFAHRPSNLVAPAQTTMTTQTNT